MIRGDSVLRNRFDLNPLTHVLTSHFHHPETRRSFACCLGLWKRQRGGVQWYPVSLSGGEATWRQYLTLPNILKEYNPNLKGYSTGKGEFLSKNSGMNVAFPVSADADALMQAKYLVRKMKSDRQIDFKNDWKVSPLNRGYFYSTANDISNTELFNSVTPRLLPIAIEALRYITYQKKTHRIRPVLARKRNDETERTALLCTHFELVPIQNVQYA